MIFVTLGTQDKPFNRLLEEIERLIGEGIINDEVVAQIGSTAFDSKKMKCVEYMNKDVFEKAIKNCRYLITHGGVGSIIQGLNHNKKVIAVARLSRYGEHENDHQVEIINQFVKDNYILGCLEVKELAGQIQRLGDFCPDHYHSNNDHFVKLVRSLIER